MCWKSSKKRKEGFHIMSWVYGKQETEVEVCYVWKNKRLVSLPSWLINDGWVYKLWVALTVFTQCPDSGVEPGRWVRSVLRGFHWPAFTQWSRSRSRPRKWGRTNELKYKISLATHGKVPYIAGADPAFCLHTKKMWCQTPHLGSNPAHMVEHKRRVRPRNRGRWIPFTLRGKGGSDPTSGVWPRNRSTV